jgi:KDO2-lipid IV(A) lauroyltransferase
MYYIIYAILYLFSLLPFKVLYVFSDCANLILYNVIKYRKDVVFNNLQIAFPEKTIKERTQIAKDFYRSFTDNFIEVIKLLSISKKELKKRFTGDYSILRKLCLENKNAQVHLGHFFNWEFANQAFAIEEIVPSFIVVYMPIKNKLFDRIFYKIRTRFGTKLVAATQFRKEFQPFIKQRFILTLVGDQNAGGGDNAYWTDFFGRKTPIVKGPEKSAILINAAVVMCNFYKVKRGYYTSEFKLLTTEARSLPKGEITKQMMSFIEDCIRKHPANYLWSHRRWKYVFDEKKHGHLVV